MFGGNSAARFLFVILAGIENHDDSSDESNYHHD